MCRTCSPNKERHTTNLLIPGFPKPQALSRSPKKAFLITFYALDNAKAVQGTRATFGTSPKASTAVDSEPLRLPRSAEWRFGGASQIFRMQVQGSKRLLDIRGLTRPSLTCERFGCDPWRKLWPLVDADALARLVGQSQAGGSQATPELRTSSLGSWEQALQPGAQP